MSKGTARKRTNKAKQMQLQERAQLGGGACQRSASGVAPGKPVKVSPEKITKIADDIRPMLPPDFADWSAEEGAAYLAETRQMAITYPKDGAPKEGDGADWQAMQDLAAARGLDSYRDLFDFDALAYLARIEPGEDRWAWARQAAWRNATQGRGTVTVDDMRSLLRDHPSFASGDRRTPLPGHTDDVEDSVRRMKLGREAAGGVKAVRDVAGYSDAELGAGADVDGRLNPTNFLSKLSPGEPWDERTHRAVRAADQSTRRAAGRAVDRDAGVIPVADTGKTYINPLTGRVQEPKLEVEGREAYIPPPCPSCGSPFDPNMCARSRVDNQTEICPACGEMEAGEGQRGSGPGIRRVFDAARLSIERLGWWRGTWRHELRAMYDASPAMYAMRAGLDQVYDKETGRRFLPDGSGLGPVKPNLTTRQALAQVLGRFEASERFPATATEMDTDFMVSRAERGEWLYGMLPSEPEKLVLTFPWARQEAVEYGWQEMTEAEALEQIAHWKALDWEKIGIKVLFSAHRRGKRWSDRFEQALSPLPKVNIGTEGRVHQAAVWR